MPTELTCPALRAILGEHPRLRAVLARARLVAPTRTPVLVTGESGTGKELLARALHELGPEPDGPFVAVNCGALARELAESELFGHERGAFTGAGARRAGWFEEASGGTLVLDEIGELPTELQPRLLRVLETGKLRRVGGNGETAVRVRVVAMTLRDLRSEVAAGRFRLDLFHRLAGFELALPALRDRLSDLPRLAEHFLAEAAAEVGPRALSPEAVARLATYRWPGNVRELRNAIRRAAIVSGPQITPADLELDESPGCELRLVHRAADGGVVHRSLAPDPADPLATRANPFAGGGAAPYAAAAGPLAARPLEAAPPSPTGGADPDRLALPGKSFTEMQAEIFRWALRRSGGSRRRAAQALGISRSTFCDRVKRLKICG